MTDAPLGEPQRLAVYGSLAPGRKNAHELEMIDGKWSTGTVRGHLVDRGWAAGSGFPGLIIDPAGPVVAVLVLTSVDLADHWPRLDEFEGDEYERVLIAVETEEGTSIEAHVYALAASGA
ncbi:gamma-glutamylcyclotransferase [Microbacterium aoyamense]|uniref:Gamma-glutamylcyclotransferase n=1 Tax=Microbacterium aoyamense TaxID=344166 RepID=A0ABN2PF36_9MICO|nr:gamma-glutamylcyclotransferase family protein [Microbacterium aoyamense]